MDIQKNETLFASGIAKAEQAAVLGDKRTASYWLQYAKDVVRAARLNGSPVENGEKRVNQCLDYCGVYVGPIALGGQF